jgi:hypothetical protein
MSSENSTNEKDVGVDHDLEAGTAPQLGKHGGLISMLVVKEGEVYEQHPERNPKWYQRLLDAGVEENGIKPVPVEKRTNTNYTNLFTVFFTALLCLLP